MLYQTLLALHILAVVGWAGLTTGGMAVLTACGERCFPRYRMLVYMQAASAFLLFATGLSMAVLFYGFPRSPLWIHVALGIALAAGVLELIHMAVARRGYNAYRGLVRPLMPAWTAIFLAMVYLMVFKPF